MNILYSSDTHVYPSHLDRLLKAARKIRPGAVIVGGDLIPDWKGSIAASIEPHKSWVKNRLLPAVGSFREECPEIPVLIDLGNDDIAAARPLLEEQDGKEILLLHMRVVEIGESLAVAGYMKVNPTPFRIKDGEKPDCRDRDGLRDPGVRREGSTTVSGQELPHTLDPKDGTMEDDLDRLAGILDSDRWRGYSFLFVSHAPPKDTALDHTRDGLHVGSLAVRRFIDSWSPTGRLVACLHGHIHESPWMSGRVCHTFGRVPCFNVGQKRDALRALLLDTGDASESARVIQVDGSGEATELPTPPCS